MLLREAIDPGGDARQSMSGIVKGLAVSAAAAIDALRCAYRLHANIMYALLLPGLVSKWACSWHVSRIALVSN